MGKAAKEKSFVLWLVASVALFCVPSFATSVHDLPDENRVENYDSAWGVALESLVAPNPGGAFPNRALPRDPHGIPAPDADVPHTQLGKQQGRSDNYPQAREFDSDGMPVRDIDFTDHGRPGQNHTNPHQHPYIENPTGGTRQRGSAEPL